MGPSLLLPSRRRDLDKLLVDCNPGGGSRLVVVEARAGDDAASLVRAVGRHFDQETPDCHHLVGLSWQQESAGGLLEPLTAASPDPQRLPPAGGQEWPAAVARAWLKGLRPAGVAAWGGVVVVEAAQRADLPSLEALTSAVRLGGAAPVLVVLELATDPWADADLDPGRLRLLAEIAEAADQRVRPQPVDEADVEWLAQVNGQVLAPGLAQRLVRHCGGRAREIEETLRQLERPQEVLPSSPLPVAPTVRARATWQLGELTSPARRLVQAIAVLEIAEGAPAVSLARATQLLGEPCGLEVVEEVLASGLVLRGDPATRNVGITSAAVRRCVLDDAGLVVRAELHRAAAGLAHDEEGRQQHRWFADPRPDQARAAALDELAAARAMGGDWMAAARLWELASQASTVELETSRRAVLAADAVVAAGDLTRLGGTPARLESFRETPLREACLGYVGCLQGRVTTAGSRLARAWELVNPVREPVTARRIAERQVLHALSRCRASDVLLWAGRASELAAAGLGSTVGPGRGATLDGAEHLPAVESMEAGAISCVALAALRGVGPAMERLDELEAQPADWPVVQRLKLSRGWVLLAAGEHLRARDELEKAAAGDGLGGSFRISLWATAWLARLHLETGHWDLAESTAAHGAEHARRRGLQLLVPLLEWTTAEVLALRGDLAGAEAALARGEADASHYEIMRVSAALGRAAVHRARNDPRGVLEALAPLDSSWAREWVWAPGFWPWVEVKADALMVLGQWQQADEFLRVHEARATDAGHPLQLARLRGLRARLDLVTGDVEAARRGRAEAMDVLEALPLPLDRARLAEGWAMALRRSGRRSEAEEASAEARRMLRRMGASSQALPEQVAGPEMGSADPVQLTAQELAVARLVARGRTNREVASELFLSVKTVQYHLTRVYSKLGLRSRGELAARGVHDL